MSIYVVEPELLATFTSFGEANGRFYQQNIDNVNYPIERPYVVVCVTLKAWTD